MDVIMPQMGESIAEGTIVKWLKQAGDRVEKDEPLFEISTDKVDAEIPSPADGVLTEILVGEGNTVEVNTVVARIGEAGTAGVAVKAAESAPEVAEPAAAPAAPVATAAPGGEKTVEERVRTRSSPLVRRMASEHGVDLSQVPGTGIHGRVTKSDLEAYLDRAATAPAGAPAETAPAPAVGTAPPRIAPAAAPSGGFPAPPFPPTPGDRVEPMSIMRMKIAEHMVESRRTSAHVQTFWEVDVAHLARLRSEHGDSFLHRNGVKLSYTTFFAKAACDALKAFPVVNASVSGTDIHYHPSVHLGIAVALDWGLIVPVIKNAGDMNLGGLAKSIADLAGRARSKKLSPDEVTGGTFTITNPGIYGGLAGCPIINQPQSAILGLGAIEKRPVVIGDAIAIRPMCYLSLSFDHRLIDGAVAEQFMAELKSSLTEMDEGSL
jgi:2-oxoglutarate dehydrogenase E2 component (dihydrolipoamide succinyltransferase)